jgi:hypothetical protein
VKNFLWRYWYAGNRALLVVAAILVALLVVRRLRVFHVLVPAVIVGIVVLGWLLYRPIAPTPLLNSPEAPVVKNGVAAIVVCGNKRDGMRWSATDIAPEPQTGGWSVQPRGTCDIYYHHPPDATQRENRQERAAQEQGNLSGSGEMLQAEDVRGVRFAFCSPYMHAQKGPLCKHHSALDGEVHKRVPGHNRDAPL